MNDDKSNTSISESFVEWMAKERKRTGKSESKIIEESFKDGWLTFMVEESTGKVSLDSSQVFKAQESPKDADTWKRLRDEFAPISACVDYIRDNILGSGLKIIVNDKDAFSKELKEYVEKFVEEVYQDDWKVGLEQLLSILVDDGIVYGVGTAEICYNSPQDKPILFDDYVENVVLIKVKGADNKEREIPIYETKEPDWKTVGGIARLKIINSGYKRLKLYRDPQSWLPRYWTLDESIPTEVFDEKGMRLGTLGKNRSYQQPSAIKLLPWQVFWLPINQRDFSERGVSMVAAVSSLALILERIMKAVGEGIYRAGNKKYFIVCGTEKRPWSEPYIRNIIQELKEAAEKNWSTIPVPSGFDVKEIGGQVFEASDVVEYFLKVISHAMHVPVRVVGLTDKGIEVNYNYNRLRNEVLASVKNQLILRQIWCEYGKKKTKQGGKGEASLKCPEIRFKTEGLLSEVDRLKMNVQLLNVANPLSPTVKLEIEKSICDIMGWDENKLPTQENLQKQLDEMDKALKDKLKPESPLGKEQGQPQPQTVERQEKRLEAGVGIRPAISQKGQSRSMGGTRIPAENKGVQETEEEYIQNDPQTIIIKTPMTDVLDTLSKDLLEKQKGLAESQKELVEKQKQREEEESRKIQRKLDAEIASIKSEIENKEVETRKVRAEIERINAESENIKEGTEKVKTETEEIRKTQTKKREAIDKIMKENEVD